MNFDIADAEALAGVNRFHATEALAQGIRECAIQSVHRRLSDVKRRFPQAKHLRQAVAMVGMLVGDQNAVDTIEVLFNGGESGESVALAESGVDEEAGLLGLE